MRLRTHLLRAAALEVGPLCPRARPAPHSQVGQTIESLAPGRVPQVNPNIHCLVGQTVESEARGRVPQRNPNNRCLAVQTVQSETPGRVPQANPNSHCLVGQTVESEARGGVPQANSLLRPGQPGSIIHPCSSLFTDPYTQNPHDTTNPNTTHSSPTF